MNPTRKFLTTLSLFASCFIAREAAALATEVSLVAQDNRRAVLTVKATDIPAKCRVLELVGLTESRFRSGGVEREVQAIQDIRTFRVPEGTTEARFTFSRIRVSTTPIDRSYFVEAVCRTDGRSFRDRKLITTSSTVGGVSSQCSNSPNLFAANAISNARTTRLFGGKIGESYK